MGWEVFDAYAGEYDRWFESHRQDFLAELSRIREFFPKPCTGAVEIGTGSGRFARALGVGLGIEPSPALARMARGRGIDVVRARAENLPLRNSSVPAALLVTVICYLEDPEQAFRECHRILEPGGLLVVAFLERDGLVHKRYLHSPGKHRFLQEARFYSRGEVLSLLSGVAFRAERIDPRAGFCIIAARRG